MKVHLLSPKISNTLGKSAPLLVFVLALTIRLFYDLVINQHRLASFGDGYFYLKTGQELAKAMTQATGLTDFLAKLTVHTSSVAGAVSTFGSGALADRLLLDGPVFTTYLAIVQIVAGIVNSTDFAHNSNTYSVANSVVDSLSCVLVYFCGRWAFNVRAGLLGAFLLALYPASVLNTRLCYSELFTYFLLLVWSVLTLDLMRNGEAARRRSLFVALFWGVLSFVVILAKSIFLPLPVVGLSIMIVGWLRNPQGKSTILPRLAAMAGGTVVVMAPWLWFTHEITGKYTPWVNRAPGYNLFVGNQLYSDGWRTWPAQEGIPNETSQALQSVSRNFSTNPMKFVALQLRKVARLWAGVWNDFQHKYYGFGWQLQNIFHDLIITFAFIGFLIGCCKNEASGGVARRASILFGFVALYHSVYACFEPVARYAISAMPFVCLLSGQALSVIEKPRLNRLFLRVMFFAVLLFALLNSHFSFIPIFLGAFPQLPLLTAVLDGVIWVAFWSLLSLSCCQLLDETKDSPNIEKPSKVAAHRFFLDRSFTWGTAGVLIVITICSLAFDPARTEWYTDFSNKDDVLKVTQTLPARPSGITAETSFVLIDLQSKRPTPEVELEVNGKRSAPPVPVLELMQDRKDAAEIFALQAQAMTVDPRTFRHWWAFPLATNVLKFDSENEISVRLKAGGHVNSGAPVAIFGDFTSVTESSPICLPSINKFSWVKGFVTIDRRDPRPYEVMSVRSRQTFCSFNGSSDDLSRCMGRQLGRLRVLFYVPASTEGESAKKWTDAALSPEVVFQKMDERLIVGGDPATMTLTWPGINFPISSEGRNFYELRCQLKPVKNRTIGSITVSFQSPNKPEKFSSPWCPMALNLASDDWQHYSFVDRIPDEVGSQELTAAISIAPFPADRLFLHRKEALRDSVKVRNVELTRFTLPEPKISTIDGERLY
ncbi:MAG: hypothetical protein K2X93_12775 [Candidatus Obscuribacterales bacterium]|nr:hypothetical protein [Candidatus Obscuribacterales bacterium]